MAELHLCELSTKYESKRASCSMNNVECDENIVTRKLMHNVILTIVHLPKRMYDCTTL